MTGSIHELTATTELANFSYRQVRAISAMKWDIVENLKSCFGIE